ncbi:hypothetical protein KC19_7G074000 [Ceratodon purpureus]|uniref:Uncharacterized protein n=1 Tax=Ceratodon purpureus TaxID=3225 RepID=A0A8T0H3U4_CERPU|nr:hypothetical protein KC19_7G074000 [Ceratodon purpureus]
MWFERRKCVHIWLSSSFVNGLIVFSSDMKTTTSTACNSISRAVGLRSYIHRGLTNA